MFLVTICVVTLILFIYFYYLFYCIQSAFGLWRLTLTLSHSQAPEVYEGLRGDVFV